MNALVTGATGFVGSSLLNSLEADGVSAVCLLRDWVSRGPRWGRTLVFGDVRDESVCRRAIADYEIDVVYHLAAQSIVSHCAEDPVTALEVAVVGTARLLQAVRDSGRPIRVVVSTSDKAYGHAPSPYDESTPFDARHAYEVSKACQDMTARMFFHNFGVDVRVVRAVNIYGPGDPNPSRLIPQTARRLLSGQPPLLHEGAAGMRRQYVYIDDAVRALRIVAECGAPGEAYCVGSPDGPLSVLDVMRAMAEAAGVPFAAPVERQRAARFQEIASQSVRDDKLRALGWSPTVPFADGIRRTLSWHRGPMLDWSLA
jgi:CDP-glucose 4,6-dehydratase